MVVIVFVFFNLVSKVSKGISKIMLLVLFQCRFISKSIKKCNYPVIVFGNNYFCFFHLVSTIFKGIKNYVHIFVSGKICSFLYNDIGLLIGQNCNKLIVLSFDKWMDCDKQKKLVVMCQWVFVGCFDFSFLGFMA
eukprot:TRINITY_DN336_c1_g1_i6.p2 TRINITY_DN336_c1_g1~~TRINITY_DN336_c1_g1_i6.p2  ORF type:complete len:135 (+),score=7.39 TRINITY_DN336_c1_g1_i6:192-596(+)